MTSDMKGNYTSAYTYGLDRISVDNLKVVNNLKSDPLYYLYDGRGSVSELINRNGEVTSNYNYEAFGETNHLGYLGNIGIHYENYYGYNGEDYNRLSGLQYLRARYYEPETGRFLTRDSYLGS
ncbi:RHS repeat-associated core domain-containing protein, partial [Clostridium sp.]|uniref:RHS repeat-associated core domain-containing protein n=1 Tax=Clostridium sp. TaxID=1506 RepID=UPI002632A814